MQIRLLYEPNKRSAPRKQFLLILFNGCRRDARIKHLVKVQPDQARIPKDEGPQHDNFANNRNAKRGNRYIEQVEVNRGGNDNQKAHRIGKEHRVQKIAGFPLKADAADGAGFVHAEQAIEDLAAQANRATLEK